MTPTTPDARRKKVTLNGAQRFRLSELIKAESKRFKMLIDDHAAAQKFGKELGLALKANHIATQRNAMSIHGLRANKSTNTPASAQLERIEQKIDLIHARLELMGKGA